MWTLTKALFHLALFNLGLWRLANSFEDLQRLQTMYESRRQEILKKQVAMAFNAYDHRSQAQPIIAMWENCLGNKSSEKRHYKSHSINSAPSSATYLQQDAREAFERECA